MAVNMMDVVKKNGDKIDIEELSRALGVKVVEISALKGTRGYGGGGSGDRRGEKR